MKLETLKKGVSLKNYTTFRIGGKAEYFCQAKNKEEIIEAIKWAQEKKVPFFVLGGGSNTLVSDRKFNGLVIKIDAAGVISSSLRPLRAEGLSEAKDLRDSSPTIQNDKEKFTILEAEAGIALGKVVGIALQEGLTGMEWAMGIPGTVGGAIYGNAGAFGKSMEDVVETVEAISTMNRESRIKNYGKEECEFGYRDSIFKKNKNLIILSAKIKLQTPLEARPLTGQTGDKAEIEKKMKEYFQKKKQTQPLEYFSAGSIFKNQESRIKNQELLEKFPELKQFKEKKVIPAAWLIEQCGLKGKQIGKAQISNKHSNFIVNMGQAKAKDVKKLIDLIKKTVKKKFNIDLEEEIQYLNF